MNKFELEPILSRREIEVVLKRLNNKHLTQVESNYLSKSIRPKLKSAEFAASSELLSLLDYRRMKYEREDSLLKSIVVNGVKEIISDIKAIVVFGSYVRNCHTNYRDIDLMVVLNKKMWKSLAEKSRLENSIKGVIDIGVDIHLVIYDELRKVYSYSPLLQTELEDHKVIYGRLKLRKGIIINKKYLYKKLLEMESLLELKGIDSKYIYNAIRNCLAIELFLVKRVDNKLIIKIIEDNIGELTAESLMDNKADLMQRDIALRYLKYLYDKLEVMLK